MSRLGRFDRGAGRCDRRGRLGRNGHGGHSGGRGRNRLSGQDGIRYRFLGNHGLHAGGLRRIDVLQRRRRPALADRSGRCGRLVAERLERSGSRGRFGTGRRGGRRGHRFVGGRRRQSRGHRGGSHRRGGGRQWIAARVERHLRDHRPRHPHRVGVGGLLLDHPRHLHRTLLGDDLHHLDLHRLDLLLDHHLADLERHLADLLLRHHLADLHRHFVVDPLDHLADRLHRDLPDRGLGHHLHGLHRHLGHHLLVHVADGLHGHLLGDDAVDVGGFRHLHRGVGRLVDTVDLVDHRARRHHPLVAAPLPDGEPGVGIDGPAARCVAEAGRSRRDHGRDGVDRLAADRVGRPHLRDRFGDGVGLLTLACLIDRLADDLHLLLHGGLVDRLHHGVLLVAGGRLDHVAGDVVAAVFDHGFVDRLHHRGPLLAGLRLPDRLLHGVAALLRLRLPDRLLHGVGLRVVDGLVADPLGGHLPLVEDGLVVEPIGLRGHRDGDRRGGGTAAALGGGALHRGRLGREHEAGAGERLQATEKVRTGRAGTGRGHGFSPRKDPSRLIRCTQATSGLLRKNHCFFQEKWPPVPHERCNRPIFRHGARVPRRPACRPARDCPCPVAGRSLRPSRPSLARC